MWQLLNYAYGYGKITFLEKKQVFFCGLSVCRGHVFYIKVLWRSPVEVRICRRLDLEWDLTIALCSFLYRTELLECLGDSDFLAKLHCVRQAFQVRLRHEASCEPSHCCTPTWAHFPGCSWQTGSQLSVFALRSALSPSALTFPTPFQVTTLV